MGEKHQSEGFILLNISKVFPSSCMPSYHQNTKTIEQNKHTFSSEYFDVQNALFVSCS